MPPHAPAPAPQPKTPARTRQPGQISRLGIAAVVVTVVLWASAFVGIRAVGPSFSPGSATLGRLAIAAAVLGLVVLPQLLKNGTSPGAANGGPSWPTVLCGSAATTWR